MRGGADGVGAPGPAPSGGRRATRLVLATSVIVVVGLLASWASWWWLSTNREMEDLRSHPALHADLDASPVSIYERPPSLVEAVPLIRATYASTAPAEDLAGSTVNAFAELGVQAESHAFGVDASPEDDRWRYTHWPHGRCSRAAVTVRVTTADPRVGGEQGVDDRIGNPPPDARSWLQVTVRGCGGH